MCERIQTVAHKDDTKKIILSVLINLSSVVLLCGGGGEAMEESPSLEGRESIVSIRLHLCARSNQQGLKKNSKIKVEKKEREKDPKAVGRVATTTCFCSAFS